MAPSPTNTIFILVGVIFAAYESQVQIVVSEIGFKIKKNDGYFTFSLADVSLTFSNGKKLI